MKYRAKNLKKLFEPCNNCSARRIIRETQYLDKIQRMVERGNANEFFSFKARLELELEDTS